MDMKSYANDLKSGSAYLLVLLVMIASLSLVAGMQQVLYRKTIQLRMQQNDQRLRNSLILGLQQAMQLLADDPDPSVDSFADAWMQPQELLSTEGVAVRIRLEDAHTRFNLNHLSLPMSAGAPRTFMDMFADVLRAYELDPSAESLAQMQQQLLLDKVWFENPETLMLLTPASADYLMTMDSLSALPRSQTRPSTLNLNTVRPEVLSATVGGSLTPWVEHVLAVRETREILNPETHLNRLPGAVQSLLSPLFDVRAEYVNALVVAEIDNTQKSIRALLQRTVEGEVEVIRCQW